MELDKRIINGKRPLTCFDIEEAEKYIGKLCYMCDEYNLFYQLNLIEPAILMGVEDCEIPFHNGQDKQAEFCLPCEWIGKEKKYRPYTLQEFKGNLPKMIFPDDLIHFRDKDTGFEEYAQRYNGYIMNSQDTVICLGSREYSLKDLFENFEYLDKDGEWNIFGVEE